MPTYCQIGLFLLCMFCLDTYAVCGLFFTTTRQWFWHCFFIDSSFPAEPSANLFDDGLAGTLSTRLRTSRINVQKTPGTSERSHHITLEQMPLPHDFFTSVPKQRFASNIVDVDCTQLDLRIFAFDILQLCLGAHETSDFKPNYN